MRHCIPYLLFLLLLLSARSLAQANLTGLGNYILGHTTPDSLSPTDFQEQDQPLVKGTLALTCHSVRIFTATGVVVAGIPINHLVLAFYDNRLFRITCDYDASLNQTFAAQVGPGVRHAMSQFQVCAQENNKPLALWGESWQRADAEAFVVYRQGYTVECHQKEDATLILWSQKIAALNSACDLQLPDPLMEEYIRAQHGK